MKHFHIRWSNARLDWEPFKTEAEARTQAEELLQPGETYSIERFDGNCPRCANLHESSLESPRESSP